MGVFGKIPMAHFNPAVTFGFLITRHITKIQFIYYFSAEIIGAFLGSLVATFASFACEYILLFIEKWR